MTDEVLRHLHQQHSSAQQQATYFLMAAAASAVAFAVQKSGDAILSMPLILLGLATILWGVSFYLGMRHLSYIQSATMSNYFLIQLHDGVHPKQPKSAEELQFATRVTGAAVERKTELAAQCGTWQVRLFLIGSIFFVAWHVLMIIERSPSP